MENSQRSISYGAMLANSRFLRIISHDFNAAPVELKPDISVQSISGLVIEKPFIPLSDVKITIYDVLKDENESFGFTVKLIGETQTDASGNYSFERTDYHSEIDHSLMVAYKEDYSLLVRSFSFPKFDLEPLEMEFGRKDYTGSVVDTNGNPIPGAKVSAYVSSFIKFADIFVSNPQEKEVAQTDWLTAITNEKGEFIISNIPLYAKAEFSVKAEGYSTQYTWPTEQPLDEMTILAGGKPLLFTLERVCAIRGQLLEENTNTGIPSEKIFIVKVGDISRSGIAWSAFSGSQVVKYLEGNNREIVTDEQGIFMADDLAPGSYKMSLDPFTSEGRKWHAEAQNIDLSEGQITNITISATKLGTVTVLVQDTDKQPLEGVNVALKSLKGQEKELVQVKSRSEIHPVNSVIFVPADSSEALIALQVANPSGETILPDKTDSNGIAVFRVAPGDYAIQSAKKADYDYMLDNEMISISSGSSSDVVITMRHLPGFYGVCVDSTGQAVPGVEVRQLSFPDIISTTDNEGKFRFSRESIKRITPFETRSLTEDRMVVQEIILLGTHPETQKIGWLKYNWEKEIDLELKNTVQAIGAIVDIRGNPIPAEVRVYAYPDKLRWMSYDYIFREKDFYFYESIDASEDGTFSFQLIPEFSYILEVSADGYGKPRKEIISSIYDPQIAGMLQDDNDFIKQKETRHSGNKTTQKEHLIWVLSEKTEEINFGEIWLPSGNLQLSGVVVDRMGTPLEGYRVFVSGHGQLNNDVNDITDSSGHFSFSDLCEGEVEIYAKKGEYTVWKSDIQVGRDDLRIVSSEHPVFEKAMEVQTDESLCDFEIILVDRDTQEQIQYEKACVRIFPESGDSFQVKFDTEGRYRIRVKEGKYLINATGYPIYDYNNDVEVEIKSDSENSISIPLKKYPVIEGVIHLPESVGIDEIEYYLHPDGLLSIDDDNLKIAGDGQFSWKINLLEEVPANGWLWIHTRDRKYVSRIKFPLKDPWLDITLQPEAIIKLKKPKQYHTYVNFDWRQEEYADKHTQQIGHYEAQPGVSRSQSMRDFFIDDDEYFSFRGLVAGQEDLLYSFKITVTGTGGKYLRKTIIVHSKELVSGQTKIIEIPSP
ncbi:MAG: hypothetical protein H8E17_14895 [Deltaproteobacteria bacterium]|nr:hypothetical protein [Deltaproteobacteria bacterium]